MNLYDAIDARFSAREYRDEEIPEGVLLRIIDAARHAPSACNKQPWHFILVREQQLKIQLFPEERQAWVRTAPVVLVACSKPAESWVRNYDQKNHADIDLAIAMEHIMLAATTEGLGSCWICSFDPEVIRTVLSLPDELNPVAITPLGHTTAPYRTHQRKELVDIISWR